MGYTHNWSRPQIITKATFQAITNDFHKILPALETAGSPIANAYGLEDPEYIRFNGVRHCGHQPNSEVRLPWPGNGACGIGSNLGIRRGTLPCRTCNGDCSYETFHFDRCIDSEWMDDDGIYSSYCKTAFRPYDLAVSVFLLIAKHHLGKELQISSDGWYAQWQDPQQLCRTRLGYDLRLHEAVACR